MTRWRKGWEEDVEEGGNERERDWTDEREREREGGLNGSRVTV